MNLRFPSTLLFSSLLVCGVAAAQNTGKVSSTSGPVIVEINGDKITAADIDRKKPSSMFQAHNALYTSQRQAVEEVIDEFLLERQAAKEQLTVTQLLDKHVNSTLPKDPSDAALRVYLEGVNTTEPFEAVRPQIIDHIRKLRVDKAKKEYVQSLRASAKIAVRMGPPRTEISLKDTPLRGKADAKVVIIEYGDYECPYCQKIQPTLDQIEADYKGRVALAFKDVPHPSHAHAQKASEAANCAGDQGKYWEFHDKLFATKELDLTQLKEHARALKLDTKTFDQCLDSGAKAAIVKAKYSEAESFQLKGTPSFFINGRFFSGVFTYEQLKAVMDEELAMPQGTQTAQR